MQESIVASRYAKSVIELAKEQNVLEFVVYDMALFAKVCAENHALVATLKSPIIKHDKKLTILKKLFEGKVNPITISLFEIIFSGLTSLMVLFEPDTDFLLELISLHSL